MAFVLRPMVIQSALSLFHFHWWPTGLFCTSVLEWQCVLLKSHYFRARMHSANASINQLYFNASCLNRRWHLFPQMADITAVGKLMLGDCCTPSLSNSYSTMFEVSLRESQLSDLTSPGSSLEPEVILALLYEGCRKALILHQRSKDWDGVSVKQEMHLTFVKLHPRFLHLLPFLTS